MRTAPIALMALAVLVAFATGASAADDGFVGAETCLGCHAQQQAFKTAPHAKSMAAAKGVAFEKSCETCHGAGAKHAAAGGDKNDPGFASIVNPAKAKGDEACKSCHAGDKARMFWSGSAHEGQGCASCHSVHKGGKKLLAKESQLETCASCHGDVKSSLLKRSKHPLRDSSRHGGQGKMACTDCHNPHGSQAEKLMAGKSVNDTCYSCHNEKKSPMLWEHGPVKEDCLTCHTPHGSSNDKLLVMRPPRLCQSCHMQGRHQSGTLGANSVYAVGKACLNCHPMVHGSNHPSGPVLQR
ncbi:MAG: DmsE family decaheme c-type cytochrome [Elusimicrobia bacterium]|nr:DmsE family decaheme c-type cytochrome [Elusimicrobiota bacterium]